MKKYLVFLTLCLSFVGVNPLIAAASTPPATSQAQIDDLNEKIKDLEDERDKYRARATRAQDQGDRLQFENGMLTEARRYWIAADAYKEIADKIDEEIRALKKKRDELQQKNDPKTN